MKRLLCLALMVCFASPVLGGDVDFWKRYPIATVPTIDAPPTIDGDVDRREWQSATSLANMVDMLHGVSDDQHRTVYIASDAQNLYIAFRLQRPSGAAEPGMPATTGEVNGISTDAIEIMIDAKHTHGSYYGFALFANGAYVDGIGNPGMNKTIDHEW